MNSTIKAILRIFAVLLFLAGLTVFLQGINILPGSYMTGDPQWAINGSVAMFIAFGIFWFVNRK